MKGGVTLLHSESKGTMEVRKVRDNGNQWDDSIKNKFKKGNCRGGDKTKGEGCQNISVKLLLNKNR